MGLQIRLFLTIAFLISVESVKAENSGVVSEIKGFENWKALVKDLPVTFQMISLCSHPGFAKVPSEPIGMHANSANGTVAYLGDKKVSVYANDSAYSHIVNGEAGDFPLGAMIVKEKIRDGKNHAHNSLGIMIKQKVGFDPVNANWEFVFVDDSQKVARGSKELANCYACHRGGDSFGQKAADFVFVSTYKEIRARSSKAINPTAEIEPSGQVR